MIFKSIRLWFVILTLINVCAKVIIIATTYQSKYVPIEMYGDTITNSIGIYGILTSTVWCIRLNLLMQIVSIIFVPARAIHFVDELQELQELNGDNSNFMATTIAVNILAMIFAVLVICNVLLSHWIIEEEKNKNPPKTERLYPRIPAPQSYIPNHAFFETKSRIMASAPILTNSYQSDTEITYHDC